MKRIILHIGHQKTGSTSLQEFLAEKREELQDKNICYYKPCFRYAPWVGQSNADFLLADTLCKLGEPVDPIKKEMFNKNNSLNVFYVLKRNCDSNQLEQEKNNFIKQLDKYDTIILSEEMLFHYDYFYDNYWSTIYDYLNECTNDNVFVDVVAYIRRQDDWVLSKWKQDVRNPIPFPWGFEETLKEYLEFGYLNYYETLLRLEKVFGKKHLIIRNYDRKKLYNNNIVDDFFNACNIDFDYDNTLKTEENPSQALTSAYGLSAINRNLVKCNLDRITLFIGTNRYIRLSSKQDCRAQALDNKERIELLNTLKESNDNISKHFFNGKDFFDNNMYVEEKSNKVIKSNPFFDRLYAYKLILISLFKGR